jgi:uncharacterized membrane protein YphA (DoxX/SURF4 family)
MKVSVSFKNAIVDIICLLYILLFVYAAVSKLMDFQNFRVQVAQSPLLTAFAGFVAAAVIIIEIIISVLLSFPLSRKLGMYSALTLMTLFSIYIFIILNYSPFVPCSCGGVLESMGWIQHFVFNVFFCLLAVIAIYIKSYNDEVKRHYIAIRITSILVVSVLVMSSLFFASEDIVHNRNDFVRTFPPFPAKRIKAIDLKYNSYYFAGKSDDNIFLGNSSAPALVTVIDSSLVIKETYRIEIKDTVFKFHNVQLRVIPPNFYLFDGTVPCVFKGVIGNRKAKLKSNILPGFTSAEVMDPSHLLIRTLSRKGEHLLMIVNIDDPLKRFSNPGLLEKQQDGIFDTDGTFHYDWNEKKMVYVYYYRNQYIIADDSLKLITKANTIDTTSKARIKTEYVKKQKQRKFAAPPFMVNRVTAINRNLLFVNSTLPGKYESEKMWNNANVIDVYDTNDQSYVMSFYVYKVDGGQITSMMVTDNYLYALIGTNMVSYKLSQILKDHFKKNK